MKEISLIKHSNGAFGLRFFGLGSNLKPNKGLLKLQNLLNQNTFWAQGRNINDLKRCLANSDVIVSLWERDELVGFGRALSDGVYRGVLWDIVIDQDHQGKGRLLCQQYHQYFQIFPTDLIGCCYFFQYNQYRCWGW